MRRGTLMKHRRGEGLGGARFGEVVAELYLVHAMNEPVDFVDAGMLEVIAEEEDVGTLAAYESIIPRAAIESVFSGTAVENVFCCASVEIVVTALAINGTRLATVA